MIWIIGGTSEARELTNNISDLNNIIITAATEAEKEFIDSPDLIVGRMDYDQMLKFIEKNHISMIVNLAHPYATVVTENARNAALENSIKYIRYIRRKTTEDTNGIYLNNYEEAYDYISQLNGNIFFTTGSKNIGDFEKIKGNNRFIYRILPAMESLEECREHNIELKNIIAVLGPFSKECNKLMFKEYDADYVIMKDSGHRGGTLEKLQACEELGIIPIIIGRKDEDGIHTLGEIEKIIRGHR